MSIVITGGGTGGHLAIAKAIKEELNKRAIKPIFIGSTKGQDRDWFGDDEGWEERYFLETSGVVDKRGFAKLQSLWKISKNVLEIKKIFDRYRVKRVLSVGGYSAAPASIGAVIYRKNLFIHEQNAVMGRLNRSLKPFAKKLFLDHSYYPVQEIFFQQQRVREEIKTIIFLGGSQGAKAINEFAFNIAPLLKERDIKIIHQCGKRDFDRCKEFYQKEGIEVDLFDFSDKLPLKMSMADFAISRSGAGMLWELTACGLPALFIPYPYAAGDHQYYNAKYLSDQNLALLRREDELNEDDILSEIFKLDLKEMSQRLIFISDKSGAKHVVDELLG